jgi:hypothetical protein
MVDVLGILCSSICVIYVLIRTAQIDRTVPWFEAESPGDGNAGADKNSGSGSGSNRGVRRY